MFHWKLWGSHRFRWARNWIQKNKCLHEDIGKACKYLRLVLASTSFDKLTDADYTELHDTMDELEGMGPIFSIHMVCSVAVGIHSRYNSNIWKLLHEMASLADGLYGNPAQRPARPA